MLFVTSALLPFALALALAIAFLALAFLTLPLLVLALAIALLALAVFLFLLGHVISPRESRSRAKTRSCPLLFLPLT